jgi:PAS domain S-box-containing protein
MKEIEDRIKNQEGQYGLLAKRLVDAIWVVDIESMKYVYMTPSVETLRGYTPEELKDVPIKDHMTPVSYEAVTMMLAEELGKFNNGEEVSRTIELEMYHKDGSTVWLEATARFYKELDGTIRVIGISKNINERKKFEKERETLIRQLEEALAEKDRLLKENKVLMGLLPICSECKKIRDENGKWWPVEEYIASRTDADFTHTICPDCKEKLYSYLKKK